jgi:TRAP-type C4-dicarboxylate transport system permease small subunit
MSSAEQIYSIADNHAQTVQVCIDRLHESVATIPMGLRILAIVLRALFIGALVAVTVRVSSPQSESLASVYETPGDLIRLALGFAVCLWIVIHLFMLPRTAEGYRTWVYLGLVVAHSSMDFANRG